MLRIKNLPTRLISIVLSLLLVFYTLPIASMAQIDNPEETGPALSPDASVVLSEEQQGSQANMPYSYSSIKEDEEFETGRIVGEITDKREINVKHFRTDNGLVIAATYPYPVHYEENGQWMDIDNTIVTDSSEPDRMQTANGIMTAGFAKRPDDHMMSFSDGETTVAMGLVSEDMSLAAASVENPDALPMSGSASIAGTASVNGTVGNNGSLITGQDDTDLLSDEEYNEKIMSLDNLTSKVTYEGILPDTDIEYTVNPTGIKENIIVNAVQDEYEYMFALDTDGLVPVQEAYDTINLYEANTDELKYSVTAGYMTDALGDESFDVSLTLIDEDGVYYAKVSADSDWINDESRVFPVKIDPTVKAEKSRDAYQDVTIRKNTSTGATGTTDSVLRIGTTQSQTLRAFMRFDQMPDIASDEQVVAANLRLIAHESISSSVDNNIIIYKVTKPWNESSHNITWATHGGTDAYDSERVITYTKIGSSYSNRDFDVTGLVKEWYLDPETNYGVMVTLSKEDYNWRNYTFCEESYSSGNQPTLTVTYLDTTGLESQWSYHTVSNGVAGSVSVNDFTGHATYVHNDVSLSGSVLPVSVSHIHNQYEKDLDVVYGSSMKFGMGWRLSAIESVQKVTADGIKNDYPYKYIDSDGTEHYFNKKKSGESYYRLETDDTLSCTTITGPLRLPPILSFPSRMSRAMKSSSVR